MGCACTHHILAKGGQARLSLARTKSKVRGCQGKEMYILLGTGSGESEMIQMNMLVVLR